MRKNQGEHDGVRDTAFYTELVQTQEDEIRYLKRELATASSAKERLGLDLFRARCNWQRDQHEWQDKLAANDAAWEVKLANQANAYATFSASKDVLIEKLRRDEEKRTKHNRFLVECNSNLYESYCTMYVSKTKAYDLVRGIPSLVADFRREMDQVITVMEPILELGHECLKLQHAVDSAEAQRIDALAELDRVIAAHELTKSELMEERSLTSSGLTQLRCRSTDEPLREFASTPDGLRALVLDSVDRSYAFQTELELKVKKLEDRISDLTLKRQQDHALIKYTQSCFTCPISQEIIDTKCVVSEYGYLFAKESYEQLLGLTNPKCPMSMRPIHISNPFFHSAPLTTLARTLSEWNDTV